MSNRTQRHIIQAETYSDEDDEMMQEQVPMAAGIPEHTSLESFGKPQTITFDIDVVGSPEQLASGYASNTWSLNEELHKHLKQNTATTDRLNAGDEHLQGDLRQCVPLAFEVVEHGNSFPFAMAFNVPGLMPKTISAHGAWAHRTAAKTPVIPLNGAVKFEPTNVIDRALLAKSQQNTLSDIDNDVTLQKDFGIIKVNSPAYFKMTDALEAGEWADISSRMSDEEYMSIVDPAKHVRVVQVPLAIAQTLKENLSSSVEEFRKRCVNLVDFQIVADRADGIREFNTTDRFVGEQVGVDLDAENELSTIASNTVQQYHAKCTLSFCLSRE